VPQTCNNYRNQAATDDDHDVLTSLCLAGQPSGTHWDRTPGSVIGG
jgi:hypothetical protein